MATDRKKGRRKRAYLIWIDESGICLIPPVRRTWAPRGQTPILKHPLRPHERKLSVIGALSLSPRRRQLGLYLGWQQAGDISEDHLVAFLRQLLRAIRGPILLIWDRLPSHRSGLVRQFVASHRRLDVEELPAHSPELNPLEYFWAYLKGGELANHQIEDLDRLARTLGRAADKADGQQHLLRAFVRATRLPIRLPK